MAELVVLHERAVDDRHAEVDVEQDRHRLQLAHDDVAQNAHERKESLAVRAPARQLARPRARIPRAATRAPPARTMRATRIGCSSDEQRHPPSAEPLEDRHLLARRDGECDRLARRRRAGSRSSIRRPARPARVMRSRMYCTPDGRVARDDAPLGLVVEPERGNALVLAVEDSGLAVRRRRRQPAEPAAQRVAFLADHLRDRRAVAQLDRATQLGVRRARRSAASRARVVRRPVAARGGTRDI